MDYDFITTCNWTSTGTFTLSAYRGSDTNVATSYTLYYRKKGSPTWNSTTNGEIVIDSAGEWEVANDWNKSGNNVLTHSYYGITAINSCTNVYFNEVGLGTTVGDAFLNYCWLFCSNLTSMPVGFNLPQGITTVGDAFLNYCWFGCTNLESMPEGFNLPQGITTVGDAFLNCCWGECSNLVSMPVGFNIPSGIVGYVGYNFLGGTWMDCSSLVSIPSGFNIPSGITGVHTSYGLGSACWLNCTNLKQDGYTEDLVFEFNSPNNIFGGTCPIVPDSITGASKANPVYVAVNRPPPPPDVTVDIKPDEAVVSSIPVGVGTGVGIDITTSKTILSSIPVDEVETTANVDTTTSKVTLSSLPIDKVQIDIRANASLDQIAFSSIPIEEVKTTANVNANLNRINLNSLSPEVSTGVAVTVDLNQIISNSFRAGVVGGEGIAFDTNLDNLNLASIAIKSVEQGNSYSPLVSALTFRSPEIKVETEYKWGESKKRSLVWSSQEKESTNWNDQGANKTVWS